MEMILYLFIVILTFSFMEFVAWFTHKYIMLGILWHLHKDHHQPNDKSIFEKNDYIGGHTHTHKINLDGKDWHVDSGFIVYNENTYPNFIKLLTKLEVQPQLSSMGFSVKSLVNNFEYAGNSLNAVFAQRRNIINPSFYKMLLQIIRFNDQAQKDLNGLDYSKTLKDYLNENY